MSPRLQGLVGYNCSLSRMTVAHHYSADSFPYPSFPTLFVCLCIRLLHLNSLSFSLQTGIESQSDCRKLCWCTWAPKNSGSAVCAGMEWLGHWRGKHGLVFNHLFSSSINQTDQMLVHLQSFDTVPEHFTIPESTKNGVPLFYIPPGSTTPVWPLSVLLSMGQVSFLPVLYCTRQSWVLINKQDFL